MTSPIASRTRRIWQFAALLVALPLALAAHSWETAMEWWGAQDLFATQVTAGEAVDYAGARWRLENLSKIATQRDGSAIVLAEIEATVTDKEAFLLLPCSASLSGPDYRIGGRSS